VADKFLPSMDSPLLKKITSRRSRPSLRNILFAPHGEPEGERNGQREDLRTRGDQPAEQGEGSDAPSEDEPKRGFRGRARSISQTVSDLLGGKKRRRRRRSTNPSEDGGDVSGSSSTGGSADRSTETV
jgi:hypothetical protein